MKKHTFLLISLITVFASFAQNKDTNAFFVRQDTISLKASECAWIIKPLEKDNSVSSSETGNSIPQLLLQAIEKGKLKAFDSWTDKPIPAKEIYTWQMRIDTIDVSGDSGNPKFGVVQKIRTANDIPRIRVCQDWYFDLEDNKLFTRIKWIEFMEFDPYSFNMENRDIVPFCRIYY
ncbi:hypothetical protein [Flavobacterium laiguense]|uniref:Uncharacterized protein n=1 Tax=Flavobacterium laiguense TaxID=2169409 RepID=A0A2U1JWH1_9FLAO|nr:hypothetical protein [Flavobacterium laiguense]PWA09168.1 hypothetical protein DB891_09525 [Flavobacterium laiguense]